MKTEAMEYIIAMKSGASFKVNIKDLNKFIKDLQDVLAIGSNAKHNYYANGGIMICIEDISAIYPSSAQNATATPPHASQS